MKPINQAPIRKTRTNKTVNQFRCFAPMRITPDFSKTQEEKDQLSNAKIKYRETMKNQYGEKWKAVLKRNRTLN